MRWTCAPRRRPADPPRTRRAAPDGRGQRGARARDAPRRAARAARLLSLIGRRHPPPSARREPAAGDEPRGIAPVNLHATVLRRRASSYRRQQPLSGFTRNGPRPSCCCASHRPPAAAEPGPGSGHGRQRRAVLERLLLRPRRTGRDEHRRIRLDGRARSTAAGRAGAARAGAGARVGRGHGVPLRCGPVGAAPSDPRRLTRHRDGDHHDRRAARLGPDHNPSGHGSGTGCDAAPGEVGRTPAPPTGIRARRPASPARGPDGRPGRGVHAPSRRLATT